MHATAEPAPDSVGAVQLMLTDLAAIEETVTQLRQRLTAFVGEFRSTHFIDAKHDAVESCQASVAHVDHETCSGAQLLDTQSIEPIDDSGVLIDQPDPACVSMELSIPVCAVPMDARTSAETELPDAFDEEERDGTIDSDATDAVINRSQVTELAVVGDAAIEDTVGHVEAIEPCSGSDEPVGNWIFAAALDAEAISDFAQASAAMNDEIETMVDTIELLPETAVIAIDPCSSEALIPSDMGDQAPATLVVTACDMTHPADSTITIPVSVLQNALVNSPPIELIDRPAPALAAKSTALVLALPTVRSTRKRAIWGTLAAAIATIALIAAALLTLSDVQILVAQL